MLKAKQLALLFLISLASQAAFSQLGFSHEIGVITGPVAFQSDFGVRNDFETNKGNTGIGVGIVHYINFAYRADCNCYTTDNFFNDHFKLRTEISWNKTKLNHFGKWVDDSRGTVEADQLRGHEGEANNFDIGMQLEFFPLSIRSFQAFGYKFAPFVSLGAHYVSYNPKVATSYGNGDPDNFANFYNPWYNTHPQNTINSNFPEPINVESGSTWSIVSSVGVRYKVAPLADVMVDLRWQYYFSDWVDGLNHQLDSNKNNDWLVWFNVGYIYYLD
ncbi:THC0290_0291 family protein [Pontimicrobium sp. MEBiC01747]|jgi:hypothetical protein